MPSSKPPASPSPEPLYHPRGEMCLGCVHLLRNCSHLPFKTMKPLERYGNGAFVEVRCTHHEKSHEPE